MNFKLPKLITAIAVFMFTSGVFAQEAPKYDYNEAFKPFFYTSTGTETRSASGQPGHNTGKIPQIMYLMYLLMMPKTRLQVLLKLHTPITAQTNWVFFGCN